MRLFLEDGSYLGLSAFNFPLKYTSILEGYNGLFGIMDFISNYKIGLNVLFVYFRNLDLYLAQIQAINDIGPCL